MGTIDFQRGSHSHRGTEHRGSKQGYLSGEATTNHLRAPLRASGGERSLSATPLENTTWRLSIGDCLQMNKHQLQAEGMYWNSLKASREGQHKISLGKEEILKQEPEHKDAGPSGHSGFPQLILVYRCGASSAQTNPMCPLDRTGP